MQKYFAVCKYERGSEKFSDFEVCKVSELLDFSLPEIERIDRTFKELIIEDIARFYVGKNARIIRAMYNSDTYFIHGDDEKAGYICTFLNWQTWIKNTVESTLTFHTLASYFTFDN